MSKADAKRERDQRKAREELERGLQRQNADLVMDALVRLPEDGRIAYLARAGAVVSPALATAVAARDVGALTRWAARLDREMRVIEHTAVDARETRWALLWACARAGDFARAERAWRPLAEAVAAEAPALAATVDAYLEARGKPDPATFGARIPKTMQAKDVGRAALRKTPALPVDGEDAERVVLEACATDGWDGFARDAEAWLSEAPPSVRSRIRVLVTELAVRELLMRCAGALPVSYAPAALVARAAETAPSARSAEEDARVDAAVLIALRIVLRAFACGDVSAPPVNLLLALVRQATRAPALREPVAAALVTLVTSARFDRLAGALPELYASAPSAELWVRAVVGIDTAEQRRFKASATRSAAPPPAWIDRALPALLAQPGSLHAAVAALDPRDQYRLVRFVECAIPDGHAVDFIEALWDRSSAELRRELASAAREVLNGTAEPYFCDHCDLPHSGTVSDFASLSARGRALWSRLEPLVLAYDPLFLRLALARITDRPDVRTALKRFTSEGDPPIENFLIAAKLAQKLGFAADATAIRTRMRNRFTGAPEALARGLSWALENHGARSNARVMLAEALVEATTRGSGGSRARSPLVDEMLAYAKRIVMRRRKATLRPGTQLSLTHQGSHR